MFKLIFVTIFYVSVIQSQSLYRYEIIVDHLDLPKRDELFDYGTLRVKKYNRTTYVLNGYYDILKPFSDELTSQFDVYAYQGNEYRKIIEKKYTKICTAMREDKLIVAKTIEKTSLAPEIKSCPLEPQRVHFYDVNMPADFLPLEPPSSEKYRVNIMYFLQDKVMTNFSMYFLLKKMDGGEIAQAPKLA